MRRMDNKYSPYLILAAILCASAPNLTYAQPEHASSSERGSASGDRGVEFGLHAQLGALSPTGLAGGYLSLSPIPEVTLMVGGGYALPDGTTPSWRVGLGIAGHLWRSIRHSLSAEVWAALGPWSGLGDAGQTPGETNGEWDRMPSGHVNLAYTLRISGHVQLRSFVGVMTNFGADPSNECSSYCNGPVIAPSFGISLGYIL